MHGTQKPQAGGVNWKAWLGTALAPLVLAAGCQTNTGTGMLAGGAIGALAGGAIGAATHHAGTGALIGAAAGTAVGGLTAQAVNNHEQKQAVQAAAQHQAIGLQDVIDMTKSGTTPEIILNQIRTSGTVFHLSGQDIIWLQQNHVDPGVIEAMQATATQPPAGPPVVYMRSPPPPSVIYVEPPPPPVGVGFVIRGGR